MTTKKSNVKTTVTYKGQEIEIDLTKRPPLELLEVKTNPMSSTPIKRQLPDGRWEVVRYLPSYVLRQIFIKMGFKKIVEKVQSVEAPDGGTLFHIIVKVITPDGDQLNGYSGEYVGKSKITKASLGALKAIESRAIKDALRWKYPFFTMDGDFTEDEIEKSDYSDSTTAIQETKEPEVNQENKQIDLEEAFTSLGKALEISSSDIKKLIKQFKGTDFMKAYNKVRPILEKGYVNNKPINQAKEKLILVDNVKKLYDSNSLKLN